MSRILPAMRVSLGLVLVVISIILISDMIGIIPDPEKAEIEGRKKLAETLAVQFSLAAVRHDYNVITASMKLLVERNDDVLSAGLRTVRGDLLATAGDHNALWEPMENGKSTSDQMQVPIYKDARLRSKWASVELRFAPTHKTDLFGFRFDPFVLLIAFVSISVFLMFLLLIKKIFTNIDPSSVVPTRVRKALDTLTEGVLLIDTSGKIMFSNMVFSGYAMKSTRALLGKKAADFNWQIDGVELPWEKTLRNGVSGVRESLSLKTDSGATRKFMVNCSMVTDDKGDCQGVMVTFDDVTELDAKNTELKSMLSKLKDSSEQISRHNDELRILATRDPLTGCLNRRSLFDKYESVFAAARKASAPLSCIMMDIDHFKSVNDNYGHSTGDEVLRNISGAVQDVLRNDDVIFRYGGEEFCILLTCSDHKDALIVAERVRAAVEAMDVRDQESFQRIHVTTSLGVSTINDATGNLSQLIDQADKALYISKESGRNKSTVWSHGIESNGSSTEQSRLQENKISRNRSEKAVTEELSSLENTLDAITGLPNRDSFQIKLLHAIDYSKDNNLNMAVIILDVDMFQRLNFALGHATGDKILKILASRLNNSMRESDTVNLLAPDDMNHGTFRLGGDEFGVLLTGMHTATNVPTVVNRIIRIISEPVMIGDDEIFLTCGAGISLFPNDGETADELVTNAGLALKQAKRGGVGKCCFYDAEYASIVRRDYQVEGDLRYAIDNGELELYFQPKFDIATLKIDSMEALIRWNHPEMGLRYPGEFISAAESSGLINPMGKWVMDAACRQVREWLDSGYEIPVSINLSPVQFRQLDLIEQVNDAVAAAKIDPRFVELEITENAIMEDVDAAMATMHTLSQFGYKISIDDFGIGYSSLEHLKRYPLDILKIDRCFVQEIDLGESELAIARAIVEMSHSMGLRVVAEGVETESQLLALREIQCDLVQGYLLGVPLPAQDAIKLVEENNSQLAVMN